MKKEFDLLNYKSLMKKNLFLIFILFSFKLYAQEVVTFNHETFQFKLTKNCDDFDCSILKIEVFKNRKIIQEIKPDENNFYSGIKNKEIFIVEDMNFDGKPDFRLLEFLPAGPNVPFLYWIYNPKKKIFEKNKNYEEIANPKFDYVKKEINSSWRGGCCQHGNDIYRLVNGVPKLVERFIIGHNEEDKEYKEHWKLINGKLELIAKQVD